MMLRYVIAMLLFCLCACADATVFRQRIVQRSAAVQVAPACNQAVVQKVQVQHVQKVQVQHVQQVQVQQPVIIQKQMFLVPNY